MNEETKKLLDKLDRIKIGIPYLNLSELLFLFLIAILVLIKIYLFWNTNVFIWNLK